LFDEAFTVFSQPFFAGGAPAPGWPAMAFGQGADIAETENDVQVSVDLPGCDPKTLEVKLEGDTLTIQAQRQQQPNDSVRSYLRTERAYGQFARSFVLPNTIDGARCQASYERGVLTVTLPKRDEAKPRSIDIKVHS
jgi:HSP20 family protein